MTDEFFLLTYPAANPEGYCTVDKLQGFEDEWAVGQGVSLAANPPASLTMSMYEEEPRNTVLPDHVQNMDRLLIVSANMKTFLEGQDVNNVEYYPLEILDHKGKVASTAYFVAHLINPVDCIDVEASGVKWMGEGLSTQRIFRMRTLVLDPARVPPDRSLFFPRYYNRHPILRRDLAVALQAQGFSHVEILPASGAAS